MEWKTNTSATVSADSKIKCSCGKWCRIDNGYMLLDFDKMSFRHSSCDCKDAK